MSFSWLYDSNKLLLWHNFIKKFEPHLKDTTDLEPFYFDFLLEAAQKWDKQNPKRIICESYLSLLIHEGRLYPEETCFICEARIEEEIAMMQAFKPVHPHCIASPPLPTKKILDFLHSQHSVFLDDHEVDYLFNIVMKGF